jgi:hypothetical protein
MRRDELTPLERRGWQFSIVGVILGAIGLILWIWITFAPYISNIRLPPETNSSTCIPFPFVLAPSQRPYVLVGLAVMLSASVVIGYGSAEYERRHPPELPPPTQWEKNRYKDAVNHDVRKIAAEAKKADKSIDMQFHSWNGVDHARKPLLIDDPKLYQALENLSRAMNDRNDHRYEKRFTKDNRLVLKRCAELRVLDFIN